MRSKNKTITLTFFAALMLCITACTKDYDKLNINPNGVAVAVPERLMNPALYAVVSTNITSSYNINHQLIQVFVNRSETDQIQRYIVRPSTSDAMWNSWYSEKTNILDMYNISKPNINTTTSQAKPYSAISDILDAWISSLLTDTYGDVPYSEANQGKSNTIYTPKFDRQQDIYQDLFRKLEEANSYLGTLGSGQVLTDAQRALDGLYGSSTTSAIELDRWRKFGNSLYLRLLMRVSAKTDAIAGGKTPIQKIAQIVSTPLAYPVFTSNAESAIFRLTGDTYPLRSPFTGVSNTSFSGGGSYSTFFINTLKVWGDPRLPIWATKVNNDYVGIISGYQSGQIPAAQSTYAYSLASDVRLGNMMNYPELQFILAEAALKGYIPGDPKTFYNLGVQAAIEHWGLTMPTGYLTSSPIVWQDLASADQKLEQIMIQKYFTLFFTDFQAWFEIRRTGHPILPKGPGLSNGGILPTRLYYPVSVQSLNRSDYLDAVANLGADDLLSKVWWQK